MKTINYFWLALIIIISIIAFSSGFKYKEKQAMKDFARWNLELAEYEAKLIESNTKRIEGQNKLQNELDQKNYELELARQKYCKLQTEVAISHQDPNIPDAPVDEVIIFTPDISEPEIVEIIKEVFVETAFIDSTVYPYRDNLNGYNFDLNVKYVSKAGIFYFVPENLNIVPRKQEYKRATTISLQWFGNTEGLVGFQHEILEWLPVGFEGGVVKDDFVVDSFYY